MKRFIPLRRLSVLLAFMLCIAIQAGAQTFEDWTSTNHSNSSSSTHTWTLDLTAGEILEFDWGVSSESGYDWLTITINGSQVIRQSGEQSGTYTYNVTTTGTVTVKATYSKDSGISKGSDTGWVTNLGVLRPVTSDNGITFQYMVGGTALLSDGTSFEGDLVIPESISVDGVDYTVTSVAASAFQNNANLSSVVIPATVTSIGSSAFSGCSGLTSVTIPNSVTSIEYATFQNCSGLTSVTIPNSVTSVGNNAFAECSNLTDVICEDGTDNLQFGTGVFNNTPFQSLYMGRPFTTTATASSTNAPFYQKTSLAMLGFGEGVTSIPSYAFYGCSSLTSVTIPNSVTSIGERAFEGCSGLFYISISNSVTSIGNRAFEGCSGLISVTIPNSVTSIGERTFYNCSGLISVTIPNSVTSIGERTFYNCSGLTSINIPDGVTSIGSYAFWNCSRLTSINIPDGVTSIGYSVFRGCSGLTSINIPDGVTSIGGYTFQDCSGLTSINIPDGVTSIGDYAFNGCSGLTSVTIPNSVTSIGSYAFWNCSRLTSVNITDLASWCNIDFGDYLANPTNYAQKLVLNGTEIKDLVIPEGVTEIKRYAFYNCRGLKSITIPNSVTSIGNRAFYNCRGWWSVTIPNSVTSIGESAFFNNDHINDISVLATTPPTCGPSLMYGGAIYVYEGFADVYKAASGWNSYSIIDNIPVTRVTGLTLDATRYQCGIGKRFTPQVVTYKPEDATIKEVTWSSSDPSTLTIVANTGECIGLKDGIVTITAIAKDAGHATATATVYVGNVSPEDDVVITATSSEEAQGTVTGGGSFLAGSTITLMAVPADGYKFIRWSDGATDNPYIFTATTDKILTAEFKLIQMALTDGTVYTNSIEDTYDYVSYTRSFNNTEWQALYVPFQMNYEDWCDEFEVAKVNMFHQYDRDDDGTPDEIEMEIFKVKSGTLKQNHPYLIRAKEVGEKTITLENTTLYPAEENDLTCSSVETLYTFTGTYEGMGGADMYNNHYYSMGGGSLIQALDVTASLKPFRWYLRMTDREGQVIPTPQSVRIKVFGEDDWTEGIADVHSENVEHQCYDLQGRKISAAARGLYIVNGKKVMR